MKKLLLFLVLICSGLTAMAVDPIPYAVVNDNVLTFYYDSQYGSRPGIVYTDLTVEIKNDGDYWDDVRSDWYKDSPWISSVVFHPSFRDARVTSTAKWFQGLDQLNSIEGLEYLNTSEVTTMEAMFAECSVPSLNLSYFDTRKVAIMAKMFHFCTNLQTLDLTSFDTSNVVNMSDMFSLCYYLDEIYVDQDKWTNANVNLSSSMFSGCSNLVGGDGTLFDSSKDTALYAYVGEGGYLSTHDKVAYAIQDGNTLSFYYDRMMSLREGTVYTNFEAHPYIDYMSAFGDCVTETGMDWHEANNSTDMGMDYEFDDVFTYVVIDPSFAAFRPTTTAYWFKDFTGLESITGLEYLNTSEVTDMRSMFLNCGCDPYSMHEDNRLTTLDLSNFATSAVTDMTDMFCGCSNLETIIVSNSWTTDAVTKSSNMFSGCFNLVGGDGTTYDSNYIDKAKAYAGIGGYLTVLPMAYVYYDPFTYTLEFCYDNYYNDYLTGYIYTDIVRKKSTDLWGVFGEDIQNVVFHSSFANARPTTTAHWFNGLKNVTSIDGLEYLNTSEVTSMYAMFNGCKLLTEIDLSGFDTGNVKSMSYMFNGCSALKTILASDGWTTDMVTGSTKMFYGCTNLVGGDNTTYDANYTDKTKAYAGDGGYLTDPNDLPMAYAYYDPFTYTLEFCYDNYYDDFITGFVYKDIVRKKSTDLWGAFREDIKKVVFHASFANARPTSTAHWFNGCKNLKSITGLKYLNTSEVTSMYAMFNGCSALKAADVSKFNTAKVKSMSYLFNSCTTLTSLDLKSFDTSNVTNMSYMFNSCAAMQTIEVGTGWNTDKVTNSTRMFTACKKIMGSDASRYNESVTDKAAAHTGERGYLTGTKRAYCVYADGILTFYYDNKMSRRTGDVYTYLIRAKSGDLWGAHKADVTKVVFQADFAATHPGSLYHWFNGFSALTTISGIQNLNTSDVTTMSTMFNGCKALTSLNLSHFDTGKANYMGYMFNACSKLKTIYVSDSWTTDNVRSSGNMFNGCKALVGGDGTKYSASYIDKTKAYAGKGGYLTYKSASVKELNDDFDATAIDDLMATTTGDVYTLQGIHVGKNIDLKTLPKGIYVVNGKKFMNK